MTAKRKIFIILSWLMVAAICIAIFWFSAQAAEESAEESGRLLEILSSIFGAGLTDFIIRKAAHMIEFAALGFFTANAFFALWGNKNVLLPISAAFLYACTDEIHQYFVPGRACRLTDVFIDLAGIAIGALVTFAIYKIVNRRKKNEIE